VLWVDNRSGAKQMQVIVFRSRMRPGAGQQLIAAGTRMYQLASTMPGFLSYKDFRAEDGELVSLVEFDTESNLRAWREHPEHRQVQARAREALLSEYSVQVCRLERAVRFP
jgi:heme-degrading monooxygenase HmoA